MLVQVIESGPDGSQSVIWDTEILRTLAPYEDDYFLEGESIFDCVEFAKRLETDELTGCRDSYGYNLHGDHFASARDTEKRFDQEAMCYCDD